MTTVSRHLTTNAARSDGLMYEPAIRIECNRGPAVRVSRRWRELTPDGRLCHCPSQLQSDELKRTKHSNRTSTVSLDLGRSERFDSTPLSERGAWLVMRTASHRFGTPRTNPNPMPLSVWGCSDWVSTASGGLGARHEPQSDALKCERVLGLDANEPSGVFPPKDERGSTPLSNRGVLNQNAKKDST